MNNSYQILIRKLDNFIKQYYLYEILKGIFISASVLFFVWLFESLIEYYNYTSIHFRTFLFFGSLFIIGLLFLYFIVRPVLALYKIGKFIDRRQASFIITRHFPHVADRLLNTLELGQTLESNLNNELLLASIEQRTRELNPLPFKIALPVESLKKSFYYFLTGFVIILTVFIFSPYVLSEGTSRIINYNTVYEKPAPFQFKFINYKNFLKRGDLLPVQLIIEGEYIPDKVYISIGNNLFLMNRDQHQKNKFYFDIKNLNNDINIYFSADNYLSKSYPIKVLAAPVLKNFLVEVFPPLYTGIPKFSLKNSGDLNIPFGSKVKWTFASNYTDSVFIIFDSLQNACNRVGDQFVYENRFLKSSEYSLKFSNRFFSLKNNLNYQISIIPDLFPEINVQLVEDSLHFSSFYYMLNVIDDYGFTKLRFNYRLISAIDTSSFISLPVQIVKNLKNQDVFYYFDFSKIQIPLSEASIEYYFEIFDNDYISGYKSTRSSIFVYKPLSFDEQRDKIDEFSKGTESYIEQSKKLVSEINKDIKEFRRKELNNELSEWEKKNFIKTVNQKQQELDNLIEKIKKENQKKNNLDNQIYQNNKDILEKQKQIQNILDQLMDEELKQLLKELEELQNKFDENKFEKLRQKLDLSYEDLDKNLDKTLELLKRYQVEEKVQHLSDDLAKLAKKQESLRNKDYKKSETDRKKVEQKSIQNSLDRLKKDFEETLQKNSELKSPYQMQNMEKDFDEIQQMLDNIQQEIGKKSNKKIKHQQQDASKKMKDLSKKMEDMLNDMNSMSMNMNMEDLRQIIENLNQFSFAQEDIYRKLQPTYATDPLYNQLITEQNKLHNDFGIIKDSLNSLASRIIQMNQLINKELKNIDYSMQTALKEFEQLHRRAVMRQQRSIMNSTNILALYLDELSDQLQKQMSQSGSGKGKKPIPKNAMQQLKQQQQNLKQQLEQLLDELKKSGGKKTGKVDEQIVKTLAEQEIFNKMLNDLQNSEGISPEGMKQLKQIKQISDKNINDLINKNISQELIRRNQQIKTRLLKAENAERKREKDKKRESKEGKKIQRDFPDEIQQFLKQKSKYNETLQKYNLNLNLYYKNLSKEYYQRIK
ncbi:MAG: hypothetical protein L3J74_00345 [Bacteroidales bacterium]|nr:hypothetical protein [Bacteroidales bacterium]